MLEFLKNHWAVIAVVVSEVMSFLPTKASGIIQGVVNLIGDIILKVKK